jgi:thiamine monophosphate kinase
LGIKPYKQEKKSNDGLTGIVAVTGVLGLAAAGLILYFSSKDTERPRKQRFKKMAYYDRQFLQELT